MNRVSSYKEASEQLSPKEKVGQLFMPAAFINDSEQEVQKLEKLIREKAIGSICFFHSRASAATNFEGKKTVVRNEDSFETLKKLIQRYQRAAKYPLLIAIDAEWGLAMRVEKTPQYPYAITLGALADWQNDLIYEVGKNIARDCRMAGIHWNLAPCVDINNNPRNPVIGYRSFGDDKKKVTEKALAFIKGTQSEGVLISIKHFPGHGDTATDSHLKLPLISKSRNELFENELYPFQKLIDEGVDSVMVGHLSVPTLANGKSVSSSISKEIIQGILREEMGYEGVVISDALNMHAVAKKYPLKGDLEWLAFEAGNDVLCFAEHVEEGIEMILDKALEAQIEESFERAWRLKEKVFGFISSNFPSSFDDFTESAFGQAKDNLSAMSSNQSVSDSEISSINKSGGRLPIDSFNPSNLNKNIAQASLTLFEGSEKDISDFRASHFSGIQIASSIENHFFTSIQRTIPFTFNSTGNSTGDTIGPDERNILLALFPPQVKPNRNFGFSDEELIFINELIQTKNVLLYLFGNPYLLNLLAIDKAKAVVLAYQNFKEFQAMAAAHFLGNFKATGTLSVKVKSKK